MKTLTSASANKYLKRLDKEKMRLLREESEICTYTRAVGEEIDPPVYDYAQTRQRIDDIDDRARAVRHALHSFNMQYVLPESGMTIDEALIALAQMSAKLHCLEGLRKHRKMERIGSERSLFSESHSVEYRYANYDVTAVAADADALADAISNLQLEIDLANQTQTFEVDV